MSMLAWWFTVLFTGWVLTAGVVVFIYIVIKVVQQHLAMGRTLREIRRLPERTDR